MMQNTAINENKIFDQDVKTMSYEELMESIRYLDAERRDIANRVYPQGHNDNSLGKDDKNKAA